MIFIDCLINYSQWPIRYVPLVFFNEDINRQKVYAYYPIWYKYSMRLLKIYILPTHTVTVHRNYSNYIRIFQFRLKQSNLLAVFNNILSVSEVAQSCSTLCGPMDCSLPGSFVHRIFQARVLEWVAVSFPRGSSPPRDRTRGSHIAGRHFTIWATWETLNNILSNWLYNTYDSITRLTSGPSSMWQRISLHLKRKSVQYVSFVIPGYG